MDREELGLDLDWELPEEYGDLSVDQILLQYWEENMRSEDPVGDEEIQPVPFAVSDNAEKAAESAADEIKQADRNTLEKTLVFQAASAPASSADAEDAAAEEPLEEERPSLSDILSEYFRDNPEEITEPAQSETEAEWEEALPAAEIVPEMSEPEESDTEKSFTDDDKDGASELFAESVPEEPEPEREDEPVTVDDTFNIRDILREYRDYSFSLSEEEPEEQISEAAASSAETHPEPENEAEEEEEIHPYSGTETPQIEISYAEAEIDNSQADDLPEITELTEEEPSFSIHDIMFEFGDFQGAEEPAEEMLAEPEKEEHPVNSDSDGSPEAEQPLIAELEKEEEEIVRIPRKKQRVVWEDFPETTLVSSIDDIIAMQEAAKVSPENDLNSEKETAPVEESAAVPEEQNWSDGEPAETPLSFLPEKEEPAETGAFPGEGREENPIWLDAIIEDVQNEELSPDTEEVPADHSEEVDSAWFSDMDEENEAEPGEETPWFLSLLQPETSEPEMQEDGSEISGSAAGEDVSWLNEISASIETAEPEVRKEEPDFAEEHPVSSEIAKETIKNSDEQPAEKAKDTGKSAQWEEFPETEAEKQPEEPFVDTMDYAAIFKMFAEPKDDDDGIADASSTDEDPLPAEPNGQEQADHSDDQQEDKAVSGITDEPLLAQDEYSYLDILREFMLGDQHPIFADVPGADADLSAEGLSGSLENETEEPEVFSRRKKEYKVEESFPDQTESVPQNAAAFNLDDYAEIGTIASLEAEARKLYEEELPGVPEKGDFDAGGFEKLDDAGKISQADPDIAASPESDQPQTLVGKAGNRIQNLLSGLGLKKEKKKPLNAPSAYVGFEDYLPNADEQDPSEEGSSGVDGMPDETADQLIGAHEQPADVKEELTQEEHPEEDPDYIDPKYLGEFPSFREYVAAEFTGLLIRIHGIGARGGTATMEDDSEDLGAEVNVAAASKYYGSQVTSLRMRFQIGLVLLGILAYLTLGLPVTGMLRTAKVSAGMCLGLQLCIMLLCLDVLVNAAVNLTRRKFGADALVGFSCVITSLDALAVLLNGFGTPHTPLCLFSSAGLIGVLCSSLLTSRALRRSMRVPAIGKRAYSVTAEEDVRGKDITLLKSVRPLAGFVRRSEEAPPDETLYRKLSPIMLLVSVLFAAIVVVVKHAGSDYLYVLSAFLSASVPVTALLAFALPFFIGTQRIFSSGAAIAGWSGINDIGNSRNLIVTDRDLFPEEAIEIDTVRIFADESAERIISYAGTMIAASGCGLSAAFGKLMENNGCRMRQVEEFQCLTGGGLQGRIEDHLVLCGNSDLMRLMDVKIPYRLVDKTTVLLAIDGVLYGIFHIIYQGLPQVKAALIDLIRSNRHPIFAIRDFNVTPEMLHDVFDIATDGYDFPPYNERFRISEATASEKSKISAVVCREGLGPLTHVADTGRSMFVAIRINLAVTAAASLLGILIVLIRFAGAGVLSPWVLFAIMALETIIVALVSLFMRF